MFASGSPGEPEGYEFVMVYALRDTPQLIEERARYWRCREAVLRVASQVAWGLNRINVGLCLECGRIKGGDEVMWWRSIHGQQCSGRQKTISAELPELKFLMEAHLVTWVLFERRMWVGSLRFRVLVPLNDGKFMVKGRRRWR